MPQAALGLAARSYFPAAFAPSSFAPSSRLPLPHFLRFVQGNLPEISQPHAIAAFDEVRATRFRPCYLVLSLRCLCALSSSLSDCGARSSLSRCVVQLSKLAVEVEAQCPVGAQPDEEDDAI